MIAPTEKKEFEEFCGRAEHARLVPVSTSLIADLDTPLTLFFKINQDREHVFYSRAWREAKNGDAILL